MFVQCLLFFQKNLSIANKETSINFDQVWSSIWFIFIHKNFFPPAKYLRRNTFSDFRHTQKKIDLTYKQF